MTTTENAQGGRERVADLPVITLADIRHLPALPLWHQTDPSVAALLRLSRSAAYDAATRGDVPTVRIGGRVLCPVPALRRLLGDMPDGAAVTPAVTSAAGATAPAPETAPVALVEAGS